MTSQGSAEIQLKCIICHGSDLKKLNGFEEAGLVRCKQCHFVFSEFIPDISTLVAHYENYPRHHKTSPITLRRYEELSDELKSFATNGKWIDVGCGNGEMLNHVKQRGWQVFGTEFTPNAVHICSEKGISMQQGPLNVANYDPESFDVVTSIEVLEHINNPAEEIRNFHSLLRKGGALYLTTPNFNSMSRHLLGSKWDIISYPEHLCYYTTTSLNNLLTKNHFKKLYITTSGFNPARFAGSLNRSDNEIKKEQEASKTNSENLRSLTEYNKAGALIKKSINRLLNFTGLGDTIKALYIKS